MILEVEDLEVCYGKSTAVHGVDLQVTEGELHLLVGERGAGKTTVLELLAGLVQPDRGQLMVRNWPTRIESPRAALELGLGLAVEDPPPLERLSMAESVVLGAEPGRAGHLARRRARKRVAELAGRHGVALDPRARVGRLDLGERRVLELLALAWREVGVLLLDEPTGGLEPEAAERLLGVLGSLRSPGRTMLVTSRAPGRLLELADRITVLRGGATVATLAGSEAGRERAAALLAAARRPSVVARPRTAPGGEPTLQVRSLWVTDGGEELVAGIDLDVHGGEIRGLVGRDDRGPLEAAEAIAGLRSAEGGRVYLGNEDLALDSIRSRRERGLAYLPPADAPESLAGSVRLWESAALGPRRRLRPWSAGLLPRRALLAVAAEQAESAGVAAHPRQRARLLPRGERQLLALARALEGEPAALVAACPTRGLGRRAAERVWARLRAAREAGMALLLVTADPDELLALADRVTVLDGGKVGAELEGPWFSEEELVGVLAGAGP